MRNSSTPQTSYAKCSTALRSVSLRHACYVRRERQNPLYGEFFIFLSDWERMALLEVTFGRKGACDLPLRVSPIRNSRRTRLVEAENSTISIDSVSRYDKEIPTSHT